MLDGADELAVLVDPHAFDGDALQLHFLATVFAGGVGAHAEANADQ